MIWRIATAVLLVASGCSRAPEPRVYEVRGQIISVSPDRQEVVVDHEDIKDFMAAMVMPYRVRDTALLEGKRPGDLVTATLVVEEASLYLSTLTTTGHAPLKTPPAGPYIMDTEFLKDGDLVPDQALVDQSGLARPMGSLRGHRVALTFTYTRCPLPDFCPLMDKQFAQVQAAIATSPELADVRLVSVTIDPEFDTPAVLAGHAKALGADARRWHFVTGNRDDVIAFAKRFGVAVEPGASREDLVHNLRTAVIDSQGRLVKAYTGNMWSPAELVADLTAAPPPAR